MYITEECYKFGLDSDEMMYYNSEKELYLKVEKVLTQKAADLFGIENKSTNVCISNFANILINSSAVKNTEDLKKLSVIKDSDCAIFSEKGEYIGQWCVVKKSRKEHKILNQLQNDLNFFKVPNIRRSFLRNEWLKCKYAIINIGSKECDGVYFIINKKDVNGVKEQLAKARKISMSDFYKTLEKADELSKNN